MKLEKGLIGVLALLICVYLASVVYIGNASDEKIDISHINSITSEINARYQNNELIEETNEYSIIYCDDEDYLFSLTKAMNENAIVMDLTKDGKLAGKLLFSSELRLDEKIQKRLITIISFVFGIIILLIVSIYLYIHFYILKPFVSMKSFARKVAAGDLDFPIYMKKKNYFGAFTESFDLMRDELKRAKQGEYEANKSKKELVASLSHDVKTPISTIKAICEVLEIKLKDNENIDKIRTISSKADTVNQLISNMFDSTLEDLQVLRVNATEENSNIIGTILAELNTYERIKFTNEIPQCLIYCDSLRTTQVFDNIIGNAYKYSEGDIFVSYELDKNSLKVTIKDLGKGVSEDALPLLFEKFYRGKNTDKKSGSGLGLYLAKQFMEGMQGSIEAYNNNGFAIELHFKTV